MADDTLQSGTDTISTDHVSTLNGATITPAAGTPKVQRVKVTYGDDNTARDVSPTFPMPVILPDVVVSGTVSATDIVVGVHGGAGVLLTGTPTASSYVAMLLPGGDSAWTVQVTGTFGAGTVWFECSASSTNGIDGNWTTLSLRTIGTSTTAIGDSTLVAGLFRGNAGGMAYVRVRITGATTPSVAVVLRAADAPGPTALNAPLPAGTNVIGAANVNTAVVSGLTTMQAAVVAVGGGTSLVTTGYGTAVLQVSGTFVATTVFEASVDAGTTWSAISATQVGAGDIFPSTTIPGLFRLTVTGIDLIRARVSVFTSGAVTVVGRATNAVNASKVIKLATSGNAIGTVVVTSAPTTAVTGAFFQATQPVSLATAPTTPVTGTFFQATQPVSLATNTPDVTDRAGRLLGVLSTGTNVIGSVTVAQPATTGTATGNIFSGRAAATTAATAVLVAAPGAGLSLYITDVSVSNAGAALCTVSFLPTAGASVLDIVAAATGGGGSMDLRTPIKLAAATGLSFTTSAASTTVFVTVVGYIAP